MKSTIEILTADKHLYPYLPFGPVHVTFVDQGRGGVRAEAADGTLVTIPVSSLPGGKHVVADAVAAGVVVSVNNNPVGRLRQAKHGVVQKNRRLELEPISTASNKSSAGTDSGGGSISDPVIPLNAFFRARGLYGRFTLQAGERRLIDTRRPRFLPPARLSIRSGVGKELVVIYLATAAALGDFVTL